MRISSRLLCCLLAFCLLAMPALAADGSGGPTATGVVRSSHTLDITAPFSGSLLPFDLEAGDTVRAGETLMEADTLKIYAPCTGTFAAAFAAAGDDAQSVCARYGGVAAIEPENAYVLNATTRSAYDDPDNRHIHIGETLYFKSTASSRVTGIGRVVAVENDSYRVEVTQGTLELGEAVTLYRDPLYDRESAVGKGTCAAAAPIYVQGAGRILRACVQEGDGVNTGDLLFEAAGADADPSLRSAALTAPFGGVISALNAGSGQQVAKGQKLLTLADPSLLEVTCDVDEVDLGCVAIGDVLDIRFDVAPDVLYQGTVTQISALGVVRQNAAYYTVTLSIAGVPNLRLGMSATVYLPQP